MLGIGPPPVFLGRSTSSYWYLLGTLPLIHQTFIVKKRSTQETRKSRKARTAPFQKAYDSLLERLIGARKDAGFTQREVSALMGRSHNFLTKCESGERSIDVMELLELAKLYERPVAHFLTES
jgi:ribosome-binding protein aMBF1 (putative translation factor)